MSEGPLTIGEAAGGALEAFEALAEMHSNSPNTTKAICTYLFSICDVQLKKAIMLGNSNKHWLNKCLEDFESEQQCHSEQARFIEVLKARFG